MLMAGKTAADVYGAYESAGAVKEAAATQVASADKAIALMSQAQKDALDFQKQQWAASQANMAPWIASGQGAVNKLSFLLGIGPKGTTTAGGGGSSTTPTTTPTTPPPSNYGTAVPRPGSPAVPTSGNSGEMEPVPRPTQDTGPTWPHGPTRTLADVATVPPTDTPPNSGTLAGVGTRGTVVMQAPDGTIQAVPASDVAHYASRGAQVLS
jgi:hypothetical protein